MMGSMEPWPENALDVNRKVAKVRHTVWSTRICLPWAPNRIILTTLLLLLIFTRYVDGVGSLKCAFDAAAPARRVSATFSPPFTGCVSVIA